MHIPKKGLRALGIAESYAGREHSTLAGIVMRKDRIIDGVAFSRVTVGGMNATDGILAIVNALDRRDINVILLSGCVIAFFNIINPALIFDQTTFPVICVTYEVSAGLEGDIRHHFPGDTARLDAYRRLGTRIPHILPDGQTVYLRSWGLDPADAGRLCTAFTCEGKIPDPLRVARLAARAAHSFVM
ncbi:MAG: DUF99 family protein [Methanoregula sp.]|jgi:hypothetical protein|uniref:endonuclease dU n=1 Tax=Methanoregula sp. TaxID=2052170 RepID=UPI003C2A4775